MSSRTDFKNALQALTTTVVKAQAARALADDAEFEAMHAASVAQRERLRETHAALAAELRASKSDAALPHATWFEQTLTRAEAIFGVVTI